MTGPASNDATQPEAYDLFISYSHDDQDIADRLSRRVRLYRAPRTLRHLRRRLTVFRDREQLTASPDLSDSLDQRIDRSRNMALLASPSSASSEYVDTEVATFLERKGKDGLFVVLCRGEFRDSLPPAVRAKTEEPLFIDLRNTRTRILPSKRFRLESLRLIAALLGVDYSELRREDENRRRTRRISFGSVVFIVLLVLGAWGLIRSVPAETWTEQTLPAAHRESRLMPIRDYAVNAKDPSLLLFEAFDANYASQKPKRPFALLDNARISGFNLASLRDRLKDFEAQYQGRVAPLLTITIEVQNGSAGQPAEITGSGRMVVYGAVQKPDRLRFYRTFQFSGKTSAGEFKKIAIPPTIDPPDEGALDTWLVDGLEEFLPYPGTLRARIQNHLDNRIDKVDYEIVDANESFVEANDGQWFRSAVIANRADLQIEWGGEKIALTDVETEDGLWTELKSAEAWRAYKPPTVKRFELRDISQEGGSLQARTSEKDLQLDSSWLRLVYGNLQFEPELGHECTLVEKNEFGRTLKFITVRSSRFEDISHSADTTARYFFHNNASNEWFEAMFSFRNGPIELIDIFIEPSDGSLVVLTDREGLYRSRDSGRTWQDFNFGETRLLDGTKLRVVSVPDSAALYALVDHNSGPDTQNTNFLFSFGKRTMLQRLRIALANRLQPRTP